jgi:hypothetical protein
MWVGVEDPDSFVIEMVDLGIPHWQILHHTTPTISERHIVIVHAVVPGKGIQSGRTGIRGLKGEDSGWVVGTWSWVVDAWSWVVDAWSWVVDRRKTPSDLCVSGV